MVNRGPDGHGTWHEGARAWRDAPRDHRPARALEPAPAPRAAAPRLQRRDLQLPGAARRAARPRPRVRDRGRRRGAAPRLGRVGRAARSSASTGCSRLPSGTPSAQLLTLACDPFGEKPLYYAVRDGTVVFASEIKALLQPSGRRGQPTTGRVAIFLARGVMPPTSGSFFAGIDRLPAAHLLRWPTRRFATRRYWSPRPVAVPATTARPSTRCASSWSTRSGSGSAATYRSGPP